MGGGPVSITLNTHAAQVGDPVTIVKDGRTLSARVTRIAPAGSAGRSFAAGPAVTVGYGPGRWNVTVDQHSAPGVEDVLPCEQCATRAERYPTSGPCDAHKGDVWA